MITKSLQSKLDKLEKDIIGQTLIVQLENGQTVTLKENDLLSILVEAINYQAVIDENGEVITEYREDMNLSDKAKKLRQAVPGQSRYIDTVRKMLN